jgi:acyl-CoA reductase-like NAD-dependent aldehyde dehydrogenase
MSEKKLKVPKELTKALANAAPKKATVAPISESTAQELAKQLKRVADLMERQQKVEVLTGVREKIQEAIDRRKTGK